MGNDGSADAAAAEDSSHLRAPPGDLPDWCGGQCGCVCGHSEAPCHAHSNKLLSVQFGVERPAFAAFR